MPICNLGNCTNSHYCMKCNKNFDLEPEILLSGHENISCTSALNLIGMKNVIVTGLTKNDFECLQTCGGLSA